MMRIFKASAVSVTPLRLAVNAVDGEGGGKVWVESSGDRPFRRIFTPAKLKIQELADEWGCHGSGPRQKT